MLGSRTFLASTGGIDHRSRSFELLWVTVEAPDRMHGTSTSRLGRRMFSRMYTEVGIQHVPFGLFGFSNLMFRKIPRFPNHQVFQVGHLFPNLNRLRQVSVPEHQPGCHLVLCADLRRWSKLQDLFPIHVHGRARIGSIPPTSGWCFGTWLLFFISYMGCHPSHWRTHIFKRSWNHQIDMANHDCSSLCFFHQAAVVQAPHNGEIAGVFHRTELSFTCCGKSNLITFQFWGWLWIIGASPN